MAQSISQVSAKLYDLVTAVPLLAWFGLGICGSLLRIMQLLETGADRLTICSQLARIAFLGLLIVLVVIRWPATQNARGILPNIAGVVGVSLPAAFLALPRASLTPTMAMFSDMAMLLGFSSSVFIACWLGRSFSILPQARKLVTDGPYSVVRHPLYLAEIITVFGAMWQFEHPWSLCVLLLTIAAQIPRMHYEERVLMETFPCYRDYVNRTARMFPGLY